MFISYPGCAVIDGLIYAVGGACGSQYHSSVERYHHLENRWENMASMIMPRIGLGCAVVNRLLYAVGGYDGQSRLNQVECYNPDVNAWVMVAPMQVARSGAGG
jgi:kelch-like protein 19